VQGALRLAREAATQINDDEHSVHWQAYQELYDWCWANESLFYSEKPSSVGGSLTKPMNTEWLGRVMDDGTIAPLVRVVKQRLKGWGYPYEECRRAWQRRGLVPSYERKDGRRARCTCPIKIGERGKGTVMPLKQAPSDEYVEAA